MHTAKIGRIGVDAANRFLVTASVDKTLRVWELSSGRLLRVIRPPIGLGNEGRLDTVAISPDGRMIAAGGWTGYEWEKAHSIYLFERESGRLVKRLRGLPAVIGHLVFSGDGRYLAAALGGSNGVRIYETGGYQLIGEDQDYADQSYGADLDKAGKLVTCAYDGFIRLYEIDGSNSLRLLAKEKAAGGGRPFSVRFSPDASRIAVGFEDSTKVNVLSGRDLSLLYSPDTTGIKNGNLGSVAWSVDGEKLYAGGRYYAGGCPLRVWPEAGRGVYRDLPAASDTILYILSLRGGGVVFGSADPAFGIIDAAGRRVSFTGPAIADYRNNLKGCLLSEDGSTVQFGYEQYGRSPARFSLFGRNLDTSPANTAGLVSPLTEAQGLSITDWYDSETPKLNGKPLTLSQYETSRSLAIAPDRQSFLLGAEFSLRLYDTTGRQRWFVSTPGVAWSVNISGDGCLAAAAISDGTIRWYATADGKELLAFFPHRDRKRWVLWSPSGYYDASPGGEGLIGWHVNQGRESAADFFPVGQFRSTFYRPDVVAKVLPAGDEQVALRLANEEAGRKQQQTDVARMLPPVVEIISPSDGVEVTSSNLTIRYRVRTPSGEPVTAVKVLVDGRPVALERGLGLLGGGQEGAVKERVVTVADNNSEVSIIAENKYGASTPSTVRVRVRAASAARSDEFVIKPKLYVLAIGVSKYANPDYRLGYPAKDAHDFAATLERQRGALYREVVVKLLTDEQASRDEIADGLDWISKETTSKDVAMVFLAGHGVTDQNGQYFFLPYNADLERLKRTGVAFSDIRSTVEALAGKTLFFVDTCHSGSVLGNVRRGVTDINGVVNELASAENGAVVFAASTGKQYSMENSTWNNGAFTKALVEGLSGGADYTGSGKITVNMLDAYISERVKQLTGGKQTPTTTKPQTVPDFPVAVKR